MGGHFVLCNIYMLQRTKCICSVFYTHYPASPHKAMLKHWKEFSHYFQKVFSLGKVEIFEKTAATMKVSQRLITRSNSHSSSLCVCGNLIEKL